MLLATVVFVGGTVRRAKAAAIRQPPPPRERADEMHLDKRATYPAPIVLQGDISGVHDPTLVKTPAGHYILYGSGGWADSNGREVGPGIPTWTSVDRIVRHLLWTCTRRCSLFLISADMGVCRYRILDHPKERGALHRVTDRESVGPRRDVRAGILRDVLLGVTVGITT